MSSEKLSKRVVATACLTLTGLIVTAIWTNWIPAVWKWFAGLVAACWSWTFSSHATYGWALILLVLAFLAGLVLVAVALGSKQGSALSVLNAEPHWTDFKEMTFDGVKWRWDYVGGQVKYLTPYCVRNGCDLQVHPQFADYNHRDGRQITEYKCDRCGNSPRMEGEPYEIENRVLREIDRCHRNGEWKQFVKPKAAA